MGRKPIATTSGKGLYDRLYARKKYRINTMNNIIETEYGTYPATLRQTLANYLINERLSPYFTYLTQVESTKDFKAHMKNIGRFILQHKDLIGKDDEKLDAAILQQIPVIALTTPAIGITTSHYKKVSKSEPMRNTKRQREPPHTQDINDDATPVPKNFTGLTKSAHHFPAGRRQSRPRQTNVINNTTHSTQTNTDDDHEWSQQQIYNYITSPGHGSPAIQRVYDTTQIRNTDDTIKQAESSIITHVKDARPPYYYFEEPQRIIGTFIEPSTITEKLVSIQTSNDREQSAIDKFSTIDDYTDAKDRLYDSIDIFFISMLIRCNRINNFDPAESIETFKKTVTDLTIKDKATKPKPPTLSWDKFSDWFKFAAPAYVNYTTLLYGHMANVISIAGKEKNDVIQKALSKWIHDVISPWYSQDGITMIHDLSRFSHFLSLSTNTFTSVVMSFRISKINYDAGIAYSADKRGGLRGRLRARNNK